MKKLICVVTQFALVISMSMLAGVSTANAAATATISATSSASTYDVGQQFTATIACNGGGQNFSTCGASVSVSNLTVVSLTKGSAVSLWTTEPSAGSLNFYGGVTGKTGASSLTAYTMKVKGKKAGTASISVSGGSVLLGSDGSDIFASQSGKSFTIKEVVAVAPVVTEAPAVVADTAPTTPDTESSLATQWDTYAIDATLDLNISPTAILTADILTDSLTGATFTGTATPGALVTLYIFSTKITKSAIADADGNWTITLTEALISGVHTIYAIATKAGVTTRTAAKQLIFVDVENGTIVKTTAAAEAAKNAPVTASTSETKTETPRNNTLLYIIIGVIVVLLAGAGGYWYYRRRNNY